MPKPRKACNIGLPKRWVFAHGAYYYMVPSGLERLWGGKKMFRLGKTLPEAYKEWARRIDCPQKSKDIAAIIDRYMAEVVPTKGIKTQISDRRHSKKIRAVFGSMMPEKIHPKHIYEFFDKSPAKVSARRQKALLSHVLTKAVEWGEIDRHPFKGQVRLKGEKPGRRYVEDWEIVESLSIPCARNKGSVMAIQAYIRVKLLTGARQYDLLLLSEESLRADGIHITPRKTENTSGKTTIYEWTPELRAAIAMAKSSRPVDISPFVFCNKRGNHILTKQ